MKALILFFLFLFGALASASYGDNKRTVSLSAIAYKNVRVSKNIVFVHGTPGSADAFSYFMNNQSLRAKASLMSVDRIGFGKSGKTAVVDLETHSASVLHSLESTFGKQNSVCVGHSYGATLCLDMATRFPGRFEKVVLIAGAFNPYRKILRWYNYAAATWPLSSILSRPLMNSNKEMYHLKDELLNLEKRFDKIQTSVLIIHGRKDKIAPYGDSVWLLEQLKSHQVDVSLHTYEAIGHFIIWKKQEQIVQDLLAIL